MTLENLLKTKQLLVHVPSAEEIGKLLKAAQRQLEDAKSEEISNETRFDAAYNSMVRECIAKAEEVMRLVRDWIKKNRPELIKAVG